MTRDELFPPRGSSLAQFTRAAEAVSQDVIGAYSTSFGMATRLLGRRHRRHVRNIYALVRVADEIVDGVADQEVRAQKPEIVTWTGEQLALFLSWNKDVLEDDLFPLWRLIAYTGMRRSEALALKWSDINTKTMRISIRRAVDTEDWTKTKPPKTGTARVIDVDAETLKVLASYKVARAEVSFELAKADAYVFGDDDGKLRSPDAMTSRWDRRLKWVTAKYNTLHSVTIKGLRHTHATLLLEMGVHPKVVQERLGHSTITTTMNIYSHITPTMQKSAVERFAAHLGQA